MRQPEETNLSSDGLEMVRSEFVERMKLCQRDAATNSCSGIEAVGLDETVN